MTPGTSAYNTVLFLHILAVIVWLGGGIALFVLNGRAAKRGAEGLAAFAEDAEFMGKKVLGMASGLALLFGVLMVVMSDGPPDFEEPYIAIGLVGWVISTILGAGMIGPSAKKLGLSVRENGLEAAETVALAKKVRMLSMIDIVLIIVMVWDMTYKPFS